MRRADAGQNRSHSVNHSADIGLQHWVGGGTLGVFLTALGTAWRWRVRRQRRRDRLEELAGMSRARCIDRWVAAGLSRDEAVEFADDPTVAIAGTRVAIPTDACLIVLMGDAGAGKSLIGEHLLQEAIQTAYQRKTPLPVYVSGDEAARGSLPQIVQDETRELGVWVA